MMKQHQSKEVYSYPTLAVASHTNSPSQVPPNGAKMMWQMPVPPGVGGELSAWRRWRKWEVVEAGAAAWRSTAGTGRSGTRAS